MPEDNSVFVTNEQYLTLEEENREIKKALEETQKELAELKRRITGPSPFRDESMALSESRIEI